MRAILMLLWLLLLLLLSIEATDDGSLYEDKILLIHMYVMYYSHSFFYHYLYYC